MCPSMAGGSPLFIARRRTSWFPAKQGSKDERVLTSVDVTGSLPSRQTPPERPCANTVEGPVGHLQAVARDALLTPNPRPALW